MKIFQNLFDSTRPVVTTGKLKGLYPLHNALETMFFVANHNTHSGAHVRDAVDMKRTMITVIFALVPALLFGMFNAGYQHYKAFGMLAEGGLLSQFFTIQNFMFGAIRIVPMIAVTYIAGLAIEIYFAYRNKHAVNVWLNTIPLCLRTNGKEAIELGFKLQPDVMYVVGDGAFTDRAGEYFAKMPRGKTVVHCRGMEVDAKKAEGFEQLAKAHGGNYKDVGVHPFAAELAKQKPRPRNSTRNGYWGLKLPVKKET